MDTHQHTRSTTLRRTAAVLTLAVTALLFAAPSALAQPEAPVRERTDLSRVAPAPAPPSGPGDLAAPTPPPPVNDLPSNARKLRSATEIDLAGQTNEHATAESFSVFDCAETHRTVWYGWTAPAHGLVQFRALSQDKRDHTLAAFAGQPGFLSTKVTCNDDTIAVGNNNPEDPNINFEVARGQTYYVAVGSVNQFHQGRFDLRMRFVGVTISSTGAPEGDTGDTSVLPVTVELSSSALNPEGLPQFGLNGLVRVQVTDTGAGTATPGVDYQAFPEQEVVFGPGVTSVTGQVTLLGNDEIEDDRTIVLGSNKAVVAGSTTANPSFGAAQFDPRASATLTLQDND